MSTALTTIDRGAPALAARRDFSPDQLALIKSTVAKGTTDDEFKLFCEVATSTGLNPFLRQIHAVKRWDADLQREAMAIQVGIDGLRLVADRTGTYAPDECLPRYEYRPDGRLDRATVWVKKRTDDGTWHRVPGEARFDEYAQKKRDGGLTRMWATKGHVMLAKCAEAAALRRGFPAETSGLYIHEEMPDDDAKPERTPIELPRRVGEAPDPTETAAAPPAAATPATDSAAPAPADARPADPPAGEYLPEPERQELLRLCNRHSKSYTEFRDWLGTEGVESTVRIPASLKEKAARWIAGEGA